MRLAVAVAVLVLVLAVMSGRAEASESVKRPPGQLPRGIRNHNPGNLRPGDRWRGLASPSVDEANYLIFMDAHHGIRAMTINLLNQQLRHRLPSVRAIITKYAPPSENDTGAYVGVVARALGVQPDQAIDYTRDREMLGRLVRVVIRHENGQQPYNDQTIDAGIAAALASVGL